MTENNIKLYGNSTSRHVIKVAFYLEYKEIPFDFIHVCPQSKRQLAFIGQDISDTGIPDTDKNGQDMIPVLKIDHEWRQDSSTLGLWIDSLSPNPPLYGTSESERSHIMEMDAWISDQLIPGFFREEMDWSHTYNAILSGWRRARIIHHGTPVSFMRRLFWPWLARRDPWLRAIVKSLDRREPIDAMRARHLDEFEEYLGDGPYLGGQDQPSLADLSAYSALLSGWLMGLREEFSWRYRGDIVEWMERVSQHLPENPLLCDDDFIVREYPF